MEQLISSNPNLWDSFADSINPILGIALLFLAWKTASRNGWTTRDFLLRSLGAVVVLWVLTHLDRWIKVLRVEGFPSGHMATAVCLATCLVILERRLLAPLVILLAFYGAIIAGTPDYKHSWLEVLTAVLIALPITLLWHRRRETRPVEA